MVIGVDEVGRGCWAGPLCVAAVSLPNNIDGLRDSKLLSARQRQRLVGQIRQRAHIGIAWVPAEVIDEIGLTKALVMATQFAVGQVDGDEIVMDGTVNFLAGHRLPVQTLAKADQLVPAVSAASIVAKVARDTYMSQMHLLLPQYAFDEHVGYGTAKHRQALQAFGVTHLHRRSFKPIQQFIGETI